MMALSPKEIVKPEAFPPQQPLASAAANDYARRATELTVAAAEAGVTPERVAYGADPAQRLDVYGVPGEKRPVLVFFHGGAWIAGYLWWSGFMARAALANGFVFVSGTYRLAPRVHYPAPLQDVDAALAWVRRNIAQHGGDPARIVVGGHSAGGHLAAMSVLLDPAPASRGLVACFPVSAPLDIRYRDCAPDSPEARVYRFLLERREDDEQASPIVHAARAKVPFHLAWGERDFTRILTSNERFAAEMKRLGKSFTAQFDAGASHFDTHLALADPASPWYRALAVIG